LRNKKAGLPPGNPAVSVHSETRGFLSPPRGGFSFFWDSMMSNFQLISQEKKYNILKYFLGWMKIINRPIIPVAGKLKTGMPWDAEAGSR
jgi:hypothetical protein